MLKTSKIGTFTFTTYFVKVPIMCTNSPNIPKLKYVKTCTFTTFQKQKVYWRTNIFLDRHVTPLYSLIFNYNIYFKNV